MNAFVPTIKASPPPVVTITIDLSSQVFPGGCCLADTHSPKNLHSDMQVFLRLNP